MVVARQARQVALQQFSRPLSKLLLLWKFVRRLGAQILMYWRVHFGSALRAPSTFLTGASFERGLFNSALLHTRS